MKTNQRNISSHNYSVFDNVSSSIVYTLSVPDNGPYYISVTAYNSDSVESWYSSEVRSNMAPTVPDWLGSLADFDTCPHLDDEERWAIRGIALVLGPHNPEDAHPQAALADACWWWHENVEDPPIFE